MEFDFTPFFEKYQKLVSDVDTVFERVRQEHPDKVKCEEGCSDCCHALFDLSLVEAVYLNMKFNEAFQGQERSDILDRADKADREGYKIKREAFKAMQAGTNVSKIMEDLAKKRVRCPLLNSDDRCDLYDSRPVTCRLYGVPTAIAGTGHTCGKSGFEAGGKYPTVQLEKIQDRLMVLSQEMVDAMPTRNLRMAEVLVPVSMALMNNYDKEYLGLMNPEEHEELQRKLETITEAGLKNQTPAAPAEPGQAAAKSFAACSTCKEEKGSSACDGCDGSLTWELGQSPKEN